MKKQAKSKAELTNSVADVLLYKHLKNQLKHLVCDAKVSYIKSLILQAKKDPQSAGVVLIILLDDINCTIPCWILLFPWTLLIISFAVLELLMITSQPPLLSLCNLSITILPLDFLQLLHLLFILCYEKKSVGPDDIPTRFPREIAEEITDTLTKLFNQSLVTGVFPSDCKCCNVTPVYKSGSRDKQFPTNLCGPCCCQDARKDCCSTVKFLF